MSGKIVSVLLPVFAAALLWVAGASTCFGGSEPVRPALADSLQVPLEHHAIAGMTCVSLPGACFSGENNSPRQFQSSQGRPSTLLRLLGDRGNGLCGGAPRLEDVHSCYGLVRPHLFLCRLLI